MARKPRKMRPKVKFVPPPLVDPDRERQRAETMRLHAEQMKKIARRWEAPLEIAGEAFSGGVKQAGSNLQTIGGLALLFFLLIGGCVGI